MFRYVYYLQLSRFNPLDRGNLNQMGGRRMNYALLIAACFNPLDRGNLNQMSILQPVDRIDLGVDYVSIP